MSFRLYSVRTLSAMMAAVVFSGVFVPKAYAVAVEPNDLMQCEYRESASTEQEALKNAGLRGVRAAVGRLLCSEYGLQARELLSPYLDANWEKFVSSSLVLDRRVDRDGTGVFVRVLVTPEKLMRDLREKKYLYQPAPIPPVMVFLYQVIEGKAIESDAAREMVAKAIMDTGGRVVTPEVPGLSQNEFALKDGGTAAKALETASRAGAEVVVTAAVQTAKVSEQTTLFDPMTTYETTVTMVAFRKDDGNVTGKAEVVERSVDKEPSVAQKKSMELALRRASSSVMSDTLAEWKANYGTGGAYMVLLTYADRNQTAQFQRHIEMTLGQGTRAYLKSWFGDTAVFSIATSCSQEDIEKAIKNCTMGNLRITDKNGKRITVEPRY